ncbi:hypothetical protein RRF57_007900 [Xylaria bambusicola]|uniref:Uncharacterized protein n=1 Tax=Xylaria bambusicola TaxID=326684 RepID=A0AAN7UUE2_9PEZI
MPQDHYKSARPIAPGSILSITIFPVGQTLKTPTAPIPRLSMLPRLPFRNGHFAMQFSNAQ